MKLSEKSKKLLEKQIQVVLDSSGTGGSSGRWPMPVLKTTIDASIHSEKYLAKIFYEHIHKLKFKDYSNQQIANLFKYPSMLARLTFLPRTRMIWPMRQKQQVEMYNNLAEILSLTYKTNFFVEEGKNILLTQEEVDKIANFLIKHGQPIPSSLIAELDGRLWLYTEMIFSRWHNLGHEFHGPYQSNGQNFLIKEWHDLVGPGWKTFKDFPYKKISCYEFFQNNIVTLDIHNRLSAQKSLIGSLTESFVIIDNKVMTPDEIRDVIHILDEYLVKGAEFLSTRTENDLKKMNAVMEFYAIKPLADALNEDWHPPKEVNESIDKNNLSNEAKEMLSLLRGYYKNVTRDNIDLQYNPSRSFMPIKN